MRSTQVHLHYLMNFLRKERWKSLRMVSLMNRFLCCGSSRVWFRNTTSSFQRLLILAEFSSMWVRGFLLIAESRFKRASSSASSATFRACAASRSSRMRASSACSSASSSSSSSSDSSLWGQWEWWKARGVWGIGGKGYRKDQYGSRLRPI
jgi:hypothetical protein